jgi:uncharacterized protein (TIGR02680 family)
VIDLPGGHDGEEPVDVDRASGAKNGRNGAEAPLPEPRRTRWQPLRSGLLNLYRYDYQELHFHDGHLLLRGNNGTGKSRILALQLPFLLDGETAPHRMEPDGDAAKRAEWNLLMGKLSDRSGYTWIELGRLGDDGTPQYLTLGCGLSAIEGRGIVGRWFFTTSQRIGRDLHLVSDAGHVLSRQRLAELLGDRGRLYLTAREYRQAVDRALFHLGEQRYEALISLLIQLRQPQLSRNLDEARLSRALSEALPPPSQAVLDDIAESFRGLESDRQDLESFVAARRGVGAFLTEYGQYSGIAARRRAEAVRTTHSAYEGALRGLRAAEAELRDLEERLAMLRSRLEALALDESAADGAVKTLEQSPEMQAAIAVDEARRAATDRATEARGRLEEHRVAVGAREAREEELARSHGEVADARARVEDRQDRALERARDAGLERDHLAAVEPLARLEDEPAQALERAEKALARRIDRQLEAARQIAELGKRVDEARLAVTRAREAQEHFEAGYAGSVEKQKEAQGVLEKAREDLLVAFGGWRASLVELAPADLDEIESRLEDWCEEARGESPVQLEVREAMTRAAQRLAGLRADLESRIATMEADLARLTEERDHLEKGRHVPPPPPYTRGEGVREERQGAPLWALCDFAAGFDEHAARAGLEAALEAAGLLDAWVTPRGELLGPEDHDIVLAAGRSALPPEGRRLDAVLVHDAGGRHAGVVPPSVVQAVLAHIGLGDGAGDVWVAPDGRWKLGPLHGAWSKPAAQHLGGSAREAERLRRLDALAAEIAALSGSLAGLRSEVETVDARSERARREAEAAPAEDGIRAALARIEQCAILVQDSRRRVEEAEAHAAQRRRELGDRVAERDQAARDLDLAAWAEDPLALERAVHDYRAAQARLWPEVRACAHLAGQAVAAGRRAAEAREEEERRAGSLRLAQIKAEEAEAKRLVLEDSVGATAEAVLARLALERRRLEQVRGDKKECDRKERECALEAARKEKDIERGRESVERETQARDGAMASLGRLIAAKLLPVALQDFEAVDSALWSVTRAVEVARAIESRLSSLASDDGAWERSQKGIHRHVQDLATALLPHGYRPEMTHEDGLVMVTCPFQGRECGMIELRGALDEEVTSRQQLLDAREREVIENHLIGEVSTHLHDRIHRAEELVREMNRELEARPTTTGMRLRFVWEPLEDGPAGLAEARKRLLGSGETWSPADRAALAEFLQRQIQAVRAANETGTWQEHLRTALDYRAWHSFGVERQQDGQWKRLTRRTHGTGSGGEKAIALTVPQFAAAAAHYRTADPHAPRLILLDEAFVGVDADMRAKCMGLLHTFDLDFVMTSEREWGCYATLPGLAIYQLSARAGVDAVGVTRWIWNGRERLRADVAFPPASAPDGGNGSRPGAAEPRFSLDARTAEGPEQE